MVDFAVGPAFRSVTEVRILRLSMVFGLTRRHRARVRKLS